MKHVLLFLCLVLFSSSGFSLTFPEFLAFLKSGGSSLIRYPQDTNPQFKKVIVVVFENTGYQGALGASFFKELADKGALMTNFHAITHPSQPNYIAMIAGSTMGVTDDKVHNLDGASLVDLLEQKGKTWRVYAEQFPGNCSTVMKSGKYVRKHTPFISFKNVQSSKQRCANITDAQNFAGDFNSQSIADYNWYIPDLDHDGHDTNVTFANDWFRGAFGPLLSNATAMQDVLLVVTFDEDDENGGNQIYTSLYGPNVKPGTQNGDAYDHISVLKTIEDAWGLGTLGREDQQATAITGIWQ